MFSVARFAAANSARKLSRSTVKASIKVSAVAGVSSSKIIGSKSSILHSPMFNATAAAVTMGLFA